MPKFEVPPEMAPGIYRQGIGFFVPGDEITLPDGASKEGDLLSAKLIPIDDDGYALLRKHAAERVVAIAAAKDKQKAKEAAPVADEVKPVKKPEAGTKPAKPSVKNIAQAAREQVSGVRESDK